MRTRVLAGRTNVIALTATGVAFVASCQGLLGIDDWTPLPGVGGEGGAETGGTGAGGKQGNGGSSGSQSTGGNAGKSATGGSGVGAQGGEGGGAGDPGDAGDGSGGTAGNGGMSAAGGMSGSAGSTGGCTGTICCVNGVPRTSGSCGTSCVCTSTGPRETDCKDQLDNDDDGDTDCADPSCLDELCTAAPIVAIIPVDEDTYVYTAVPGMAYGAATRLEVGQGTTARETAFVGVEGLNVERNIQVSTANLRLYLYGHDDDPIDTLVIELHRAVGAWNETLTWNQAYSGSLFTSPPALFDSAIVHELAIEDPTGCTEGCVYQNAWYAFNATSIVQSWMAGTGANHGFALTARLNNGGTNVYYYASREYTDPALRPVLQITYQATCNQQSICPAP